MCLCARVRACECVFNTYICLEYIYVFNTQFYFSFFLISDGIK